MSKNDNYIEFEAEILKVEEFSNSAYIDLPFSIKEQFGKKRVKVVATFDGVEYRGSIAPYAGKEFIIIRKDIREQIGKNHGDKVRVTLKEDTAPRVVEVPEDLEADLKKDDEVWKNFDAFSYTHKREYVEWINDAKKPETRDRRIKKAFEMIKENKKR